MNHPRIPSSRRLNTATRKARFIEAYRNCGTIAGAVKQIGVGRRTVYDWMTQDPEFAEQVNDMPEERLDMVEEKFFEKVMSGHWPSIRFYLSTKGRHRGYGKP